jgi:hypothetical protein
VLTCLIRGFGFPSYFSGQLSVQFSSVCSYTVYFSIVFATFALVFCVVNCGFAESVVAFIEGGFVVITIFMLHSNI